MIEINTPYVKTYSDDGLLANPIKGNYLHNSPNRRQRRQIKQKNRFHGESKNFHLTCDGKYSFARVNQRETNKEGSKKVILHYLVR